MNLEKEIKEALNDSDMYGDYDMAVSKVKEIAVSLAKFHVEAALKAALEDFPCGSSTDTVSHEDAADAILNAYPPENIK